MKKVFKKLICGTLVCTLSMINIGCKEYYNVKANDEEKTYVAISENDSLEKEIRTIDDEYVEETEGKYHIYQFDSTNKEVEKIDLLNNMYVSEDVYVEACGEVSTLDDCNKVEWNMKLINNNEDYDDENNNKIDIAILDSGIDFSSDINVVDAVDFVDENNEFNIFSDITGHGTSIAGIIASSGQTEVIKGINKNVNIYSARILDENNVAPISRVVQGIYWAIERNVKIINISFGVKEDNEVLRKAINDAVNRGILVVAAAGNTGDEVLYPAAYEGVLSVGSVDSKGEISEFSADDKEVDIMAPGENVKSVGAFSGSIIVSGTSISAPHVVGIASLLWEKDEEVSAEFIKSLIIESSNESNIKKSKNGIIDIDYAFEIYDDYKKIYYNNLKLVKDVGKIEDSFEVKNNNKLDTSKNDYVSGVWKIKGHEVAADYAGKYCDYTSDQIKILKKGIVYPDNKFPGMETVDSFENPQWHTASYVHYYNYISNYVCASMIAKKIKNGTEINKNNVTKPKDMNDKLYNKMVKQVAGIEWTKELLANQKVTNHNKGLFAMGMALHVVTDIYAHQAFMKDKNGKWFHIAHHNGYEDTCDNHEYSAYKNRFQCAKRAAECALDSYRLGIRPSGSDLIDYCDFKDFKLKRIKTYMINRGELGKDEYDCDVEKVNID